MTCGSAGLADAGAVIRPSVDRLPITLGSGVPPSRIESVSTSFGRAFTLETDAVGINSHGVVSRELEAIRRAAPELR